MKGEAGAGGDINLIKIDGRSLAEMFGGAQFLNHIHQMLRRQLFLQNHHRGVFLDQLLGVFLLMVVRGPRIGH